MGVYSNNAVSAGELSGTLDSLMEDANVIPCGTEDFLEASLDIAIDNHRNYNAIMEQVAMNELNALETTGEEIVYTENAVSDFAATVKRFLLKIWDKLKAIFKRFLMLFDGYAKTDKDFVNKYKSDIFKAKNLSDFKFKGYRYTIDKANPMIGACTLVKIGSAIAADDAKKIREDFSDYEEGLRSAILKAGGSSTGNCDASEFVKELHSILRDGMDEKEDLENIDPNALCNELMGSKDAKKKLGDFFKAAKKSIDEDIKAGEQMQKEALKGMPESDEAKAKGKSDYMTVISVKLQIIRNLKNMMVTVNGAALAALKERSRQYKSCLVKIVSYHPKNESGIEEGAGAWSHENQTSSFLSGLELK